MDDTNHSHMRGGLDAGYDLPALLAGQTHLAVSERERLAAVRTIGDTVGVMLAGTADARARQLLATIATQPQGGPGLSRLPGGKTWAAPADVALMLGFCAHLLDFDDDETEIAMAHLSAPCLPAALAVAGMNGAPWDGAALIDAYVTGCRVMLTLGSAVNPALYKAGWHATSVLGLFGATAAAARLLRLNGAETVHAFGLAGSLASGPRGAFGGEGKPFQVGQAAASGVRAAQLARSGWVAAPEVLAGARGVLTRMAGRLNAPPHGLQTPFPPEGFVTKPYPTCTATHAAIAEVLCLMAGSEARDASAIRSLRCAVDPFVPQILIAHMPTTPDEGRFSLPYCLAAAAVEGRLGLPAFAASAFSPDGPRDERVRALMGRIAIAADDSLPKGPSGISTGAAIRIAWDDGAVAEGRREAGPGSSRAPLSDAQLLAKFRLCLADILDGERADGLWQHIATLAGAPSAATFIELLPPILSSQGQDQ